MVKLLKNQAVISYNGRDVESCEITTVIKDKNNKLFIHKRSLTSNFFAPTDTPGISQSNFKTDEIIPIEIQLINYSDAPATGIAVNNTANAITIVDNIPAGLHFIPGTVIVIFANGTAQTLTPIPNAASYIQGSYSYTINGQIITIYIPSIPATSDVVLTFKVKDDGTFTTDYNQATVDYAQNTTGKPISSEKIIISTTPVQISLIKNAPATAQCGKPFTYTITATNNGTTTQSPLSIVDYLPPSFEISQNGIVLSKNNTVLTENTDYTVSTTDNILTISGAGSNKLELAAGDNYKLTITGTVPCSD